MDLQSCYRRSVLGLAVLTAIPCAVFHTLFHQPLPSYAPSIFASLTFWTFRSGASMGSYDCFSGEAYIRQLPAPAHRAGLCLPFSRRHRPGAELGSHATSPSVYQTTTARRPCPQPRDSTDVGRPCHRDASGVQRREADCATATMTP